jgi:hypothetical protein
LSYRIIFDNGGGITLQLGDEFAHFYQDAAQAAEDLKSFLEDPDTSDWEGHEEEAMDCEPTDEEIRNGGYRVYRDVEDLQPNSGWRNEEDFCAAFQD